MLDVLNSLFCQANKSRLLRPPVNFSAACAKFISLRRERIPKFMCTHLAQGENVNKSRLYFNHPGACTVLFLLYCLHRKNGECDGRMFRRFGFVVMCDWL